MAGFDYRQRQDALRYRMWKLITSLEPGHERLERFAAAIGVPASTTTIEQALDAEIERAGVGRMKQPAFQFYVSDWTSNQKLRLCSEAARGAWIGILCFLHDSEEYGVARVSLTKLAKAAGVTMRSARELVEQGVLKGGNAKVSAFFHTPSHAGKKGPPIQLLAESQGPMWYSSRMVKDEWRRGVKGEGTRFTEDNQPPKKERQGSSPSRAPTRSPQAPLGDGPSVASSVAVDLTTSCGDRDIPASDEPTPVVSQPQVNTQHAAKILAECARAQLEDPTPTNPNIARWIAAGHPTPHVIQALIDARKSMPAPKLLTAAYVEPILQRLIDIDRTTRAAAEARIERTQATIAEQRSLPPPGPVPEALKPRHRPQPEDDDPFARVRTG